MNPIDWKTMRESKGKRPEDVDERAALMKVGVAMSNFSVGTVVIFVLLIVMGGVFFAQYSGSLRWLLVALVAATVGAIALRFVNLNVRDPDDGRVERGLPFRSAGEVRRVAGDVERAASGLKYSQVMLDARLRKALLTRVRLARSVSEEDLEAAAGDPEKLYQLLDDKELVKFILQSERDSRIWPSRIGGMPKRPQYWRELTDVLERAEGWE